MTAPRKVTVSMTTQFIDVGMDSTEAALDIIRGVMVTHSQACHEEIKCALEAAGAREINITMKAY